MGEDTRIRRRQFKLHLLEDEMLLLERKANQATMTKTEFVRRVILYGQANGDTLFSKEDAERIVYELNRIGNNINQIAYRVNAAKSTDMEDYDLLLFNFNELLGNYERFVIS
jgi:hypothetical protein